MGSCSLCSSFGLTKLQYNYDLAKAHAEAHFLQLKIIDDGIDTSQTFSQCFPDSVPVAEEGTGSKNPWTVSTLGNRTERPYLADERDALSYRLIRKRMDLNGALQCRLCSKSIRAAFGKRIRNQCVIQHAYCHLPTPLYKCRLCSKTYFTRSTVDAHLRVTHALPCTKQNYDCVADQFHSEVLAMIDKCYGAESAKEVAFRNISEAFICRKTTRSELTVQRHLLCYRLIQSGTNSGRMQCRTCSKQVGAKTAHIMQHALSHLGKMLYKCKKCSSSFVTRLRLLRHLKREHALPMSQTHFQCFEDQFHGDIVSILNQCYGYEGNEDDDVVVQEDTPTSVKRESIESASIVPSKLTMERMTLCHQLTQECSDHPRKRLNCRVCGKWISVKSSAKGINSNNSLRHALVHLEKPMYRCKICSEMTVTRTSIGHHLRHKHALSMVNKYDCLGDQFHAEIVEMLRKCYNKKPATNESMPFKSRTRAEAAVRGRAKGSKQAVERQLFCYRLIRKFSNPDGKIACRQCKKKMRAKVGERYDSAPAMMHAMMHLKKPIYQCKICAEKLPILYTITHHLKVTHALPLAMNYECLADEYDSELWPSFVNVMESCKMTDWMEMARNLNESQICKKTTQSELTVNRQLLCHRLIREHIDDERLVQCRLCSKRLSVNKNPGSSFAVGSIMQHAFLHLHNKMYQCKKCSSNFFTRNSVKAHLKSEHTLPAATTHYRCLADQFHGNIVYILRQCYGNEGNEKDKLKQEARSVKLESSRSTFDDPSILTTERRMLCKKLIRDHSNHKEKRIQCRFCNKWISIKTTKGLQTGNAMMHALVHLEKPIYRCRICSEMFVTRSYISKHVKTKHALPVVDNYECFGDQFHSEIVDMLRKCYNKEPATRETKPFKIRIRGKVECRLCKKRLAVKNGRDGYKCHTAMTHATSHLKKLIYRCMICSEKHFDLQSVTRHLKTTHALPSAKNYESFGDEYHSQILVKLRECYGEL